MANNDIFNIGTAASTPTPPSVGRIVIFKDAMGAEWPAIVVRVWLNDLVNLRILRDDDLTGYSLSYVTSIPCLGSMAAPIGGQLTWRWPERVA